MSSIPSTPAPRYNHQQHIYIPLNSSPLASPSPSHHSSPLASASSVNPRPATFERRRLQFKSQTPSSSIARSNTLPTSSSLSSNRQNSSSRTRSIPSSGGASTTTSTLSTSSRQQARHSPFAPAQDAQKQFLRERIKAKCLERAQQARARAVKQRRYTGYSDRSSDGFDIDDDNDEEEEEDDDAIMGDELFRRIMAQTNRKTDHSYRLSYALEVGSSFDPDMENVAEWEHELQMASTNHALDLSPADIDDEELEAYAEECARQAVLDDFADIPEEDLFNLSDFEDFPEEDHRKVTDDMDLS